MKHTTLSMFILGLLVGVFVSLVFLAGQYHGAQRSVDTANSQLLLDSKLHLIELKVDVINEQKETAVLQEDYSRIMRILEDSHRYNGESLLVRDQSMRAAANSINEALAAGGSAALEAIEELLRVIEKYTH